MGRGLFVRVSKRRVVWWSVAVVAVITPGLLGLVAAPVEATASSVAPVATLSSPVQLRGAAGQLLHLVDSAATTASLGSSSSGQTLRPPLGALRLEGRFAEENRQQIDTSGQPTLGSGMRRAEVDDSRHMAQAVTVDSYCGGYRSWSPTGWYNVGEYVSHNGRVWQRVTSGSNAGMEPGTPGATMWADRGPCPPPPPPSVDETSPPNEQLVSTLTPTLMARASTRSDGSLSYSFKICETQSMSGTSCVSSGTLAQGRNTWKIPVGKLKWSTVERPGNLGGYDSCELRISVADS
jgi:hypothetical protein